MSEKTYPALPAPTCTVMGGEYDAFDGKGRPMGKAYEKIPCFDTEKMHAFADQAIAEFMQRSGQYLTNDLTREAALAQAREEALAPITQAIRDYHLALDQRQHGGVAEAKAMAIICQYLGLRWIPGQEAARRARKTPS